MTLGEPAPPETITGRLERVDRFLGAMVAISELAAREHDRQRLLDGTCELLVTAGNLRLAWIGLVDSGGRISVTASAGEARGYLHGLALPRGGDPAAAGPTTVAIRERRADVCADFANDPRMEPWRAAAASHGIRSSVALPLLEAGGNVIGAVSVYSREVDAFGAEIIELFTRLTRDLGRALDAGVEHGRRVAAEEMLAERDHELRAFFASGAAGYFFGTADGEIRDANDELLRILGYGRAELESGALHWTAITPDEWQPEDQRRLAEAREVGHCRPYEKQLRRRDGSSVWVLVGYTLVPPARERMVAFVLDLTRQKQVEGELAQRSGELARLAAELEERVAARTADLAAANRELEAFTYSVSHDLRAPLRAIDGFGRILDEEHAPALGNEGRRLLAVIRSNTARMGRLIDDLLALSRAGRAALRSQQVAMEPLVRGVVADLLEGETNATPADIAISALPPCQGDPVLLRQVWENLLGNALKFSRNRSQRQISIDGEQAGGLVTYHVADNGVGFDAAYGNKLFGVFERLHGKHEFEGTGIGLALVKRIVERHGGQVGARGEVGHGAVFSFSLPAPRQVAAPPATVT
jgi:PAS domain S-box-containing protein